MPRGTREDEVIALEHDHAERTPAAAASTQLRSGGSVAHVAASTLAEVRFAEQHRHPEEGGVASIKCCSLSSAPQLVVASHFLLASR